MRRSVETLESSERAPVRPLDFGLGHRCGVLVASGDLWLARLRKHTLLIAAPPHRDGRDAHQGGLDFSPSQSEEKAVADWNQSHQKDGGQ